MAHHQALTIYSRSMTLRCSSHHRSTHISRCRPSTTCTAVPLYRYCIDCLHRLLAERATDECSTYELRVAGGRWSGASSPFGSGFADLFVSPRQPDTLVSNTHNIWLRASLALAARPS